MPGLADLEAGLGELVPPKKLPIDESRFANAGQPAIPGAPPISDPVYDGLPDEQKLGAAGLPPSPVATSLTGLASLEAGLNEPDDNESKVAQDNSVGLAALESGLESDGVLKKAKDFFIDKPAEGVKVLREALSDAISKPDYQIVAEAEKSGEVPYGSILKKTAAHTISELNPLVFTPTELLTGAIVGGVGGKILPKLVKRFPQLAEVLTTPISKLPEKLRLLKSTPVPGTSAMGRTIGPKQVDHFDSDYLIRLMDMADEHKIPVEAIMSSEERLISQKLKRPLKEARGLKKAGLPFPFKALLTEEELQLIEPKMVDKLMDASYSIKDAPTKLINQKLAENVTPEAERGLDDIMDMLAGQSGLQKTMTGFKERSKSEMLQFGSHFVDRYLPVKWYSDLTEKTIGRPLTFDESPFPAAHLYSGHYGKIKNRFMEFRKILEPVQDRLNEFSAYLTAERMAERSLLEGPKGKILNPRGYGRLDSQKVIDEVQQRMGPEAFQQFKITSEKVYNQISFPLIQKARESGIISDKFFEAATQRNTKYVPFDVIDHIADNAEKLQYGTKFSLGQQDLIMAQEGTLKDIQDPLKSLASKIVKTISLVERNNVAKKVAGLADLAPDLYKKVTDLSQVPNGYEAIHYFENGTKKMVAVPEAMASALKTSSPETADFVSKLAALSSGWLRLGATTVNAAFIFSNAIRDFKLARVAARSKLIPFDLKDYFGGLWSALGRGKEYREFLDSGASFAGFFENMSGLGSFSGEESAANKAYSAVTEGTFSKFMKTAVNPLEWIRFAGETVELAPRMGMRQAALRAGMSPEQAALASRQSTIDFAAMGSKMKVVNMWIPFLNARVQGSLTLAKALKSAGTSKRAAAATAAEITALTVTPAIATYLYNTRYHADMYAKVEPFIRENYHFVITGRAVDPETGEEIPKMITIPKGEIDKVFGNAVENFMLFSDQKDSLPADRLAMQIFSDSLPLNFASEGEVNIRPLLAQALNPFLKAMVELSTNVNLFTGRPVEPEFIKGERTKNIEPSERFTEKTGEVAKLIGRTFGVSPMKVENFMGTQFGGLGRQIASGRKFPDKIMGSFVKQGRVQPSKEFLKLDEEVATEFATGDLLAKRLADDVLGDITAANGDRGQTIEALGKLRSGGDRAVRMFLEKISDDSPVLHPTARRIMNHEVRNGARAELIIRYMGTLKTKEEKAQFLDFLSDQKVLTLEVIDQIGQKLSAKK